MASYSEDELNKIWSSIMAGKYGTDPLVIAPRRIAAEPGTDIMSIPNATGTEVSVYQRSIGGKWHEATYQWPEWTKVRSALENENYKWRTVQGVAKETGLDVVTVVGSLSANASVVLKSSLPDQKGRELYTTKEHYRDKSSYWQRFQNALTNKVEK